VFDYDWHGFNIPGHVMIEFFSTFTHDLSPGENALDFFTRGMDPFYLIGSHEGDEEEDAFEHELVHATYYLNDWYRANADALVKNFRTSMPPDSAALEAYLKAKGYGDTTLIDEVNAYMATTDEPWWVKELEDSALAARLYAAGAPFRALAADYNTKHRWL
jgi:RecB family exonuclease